MNSATSIHTALIRSLSRLACLPSLHTEQWQVPHDSLCFFNQANGTTAASQQPLEPASMPVRPRDRKLASHAPEDIIRMKIAILHIVVDMDDIADASDFIQVMRPLLLGCLRDLIGHMRMKYANDGLLRMLFTISGSSSVRPLPGTVSRTRFNTSAACSSMDTLS